MKKIAIACLIQIAATVTTAAFADELDDRLAALERENASLKKQLRIEALERENTALRKQLTSQVNPDKQTTNPSRQGFPKVASIEPISVPVKRSPAPFPVNPIKPPPEATAAIAVLPADGPLQPTIWTGFYIGGYFGVTNLRATEAISSINTISSAQIYDYGSVFGSYTSNGNSYILGSARGSRTGGIGSLSIGWQTEFLDAIVAGIQVDGGLSNIQTRLSGRAANIGFSTSNSTSTSRCPTCIPPNPTFSSTSSSFTSGISSITDTLANRWFVSALAKGGLLLDPYFLVYALGGWTYANFEAPSVQTSFGTNGVTVGGGIERRITPAWSLKAEYRYTKFQNISVNLQNSSTSNSPSPTSTITSSSSTETAARFNVDSHSALVGVARSFDLY